MGRAEQCCRGGLLPPVRRIGCIFVKNFTVYYADWLHIGYTVTVAKLWRFLGYGKFFKKVLIIDSDYVTIRYSLGIFSTIHLYSIGFGSEFLIQEKGSKRQ